MGAHRLTRDLPDREQYALALVIAGSISVWFAEVSERDWTVNRREDLAQSDRPGIASQHIPAANSALRPDDAGPLQREENLLEIWLRERRALGDIAH